MIEKGTICDQQDEECDGLNCKKCQFIKKGRDVNSLTLQLRKLYLSILNKYSRLNKDDISSALAVETISFLLNEDKKQRNYGKKNFKKREIK